jgi:transaldolase
MCRESIDNMKGRVLLQVLPSNAYDGQKVLEHARMYAREFEKVGISKDRFCIKIPSTGPALSVCPILKEEGIATLGTALFSLPQAVAAS